MEKLLDMLGYFDIPAAVIFFLGDFWMPNWLKISIAVFILFRGITSIFKIPVWKGPISFFAGIVDIIAGSTMYFATTYTGTMVHLSQVFGIIIGMKGLMTVFYGIKDV